MVRNPWFTEPSGNPANSPRPRAPATRRWACCDFRTDLLPDGRGRVRGPAPRPDASQCGPRPSRTAQSGVPARRRPRPGHRGGADATRTGPQGRSARLRTGLCGRKAHRVQHRAVAGEVVTCSPASTSCVSRRVAHGPPLAVGGSVAQVAGADALRRIPPQGKGPTARMCWPHRPMTGRSAGARVKVRRWEGAGTGS